MYGAAPAHPFKKQLYAQIATAWDRALEPNLDIVAFGTLRIALTALPNGKISQIKVLSNTSNEALAGITIRALWDFVKIPPIPSELLSQGRFKDELTFRVLPN